jgi:hypothetical protein
MRINATRLGFIVLLIGVILLSSLWTASVMQNRKAGLAYDVEPGETFSYGLFMAPVGLGNLVVEGDMVVPPTPSANVTGDGSTGYYSGSLSRVVFEVPVHLVVVSPSNVTLVDTEFVTPYTVQLNFDERGEYIVNVTNMGNESYPIPVSLKFPRDSDVVNREADKFLVSLILTISGAVLFCLGLSSSLFLKHKKDNAKKVKTVSSEQGPSSNSVERQIGSEKS